MPKQLIMLMKDHYPFGECEQCNSDTTKVLVRKMYHITAQQRNKLQEKVRIVRKLANERLIKIESVMEEEESLHLLFQYIPIKVETWISNINDQFIENFRDQLIKLSSFLANNLIKVDFEIKNIGMDQNYGPKYFLDLDFEVISNMNKQKLKNSYIRDITNLFKPYIMNSQPKKKQHHENEKLQHSLEINQNIIDSQTSHDISRNKTATLTSMCKSNNSKSKEKALERYYQEVNMSVDEESQKILQQFMNVLDNDQVEGAQQPFGHVASYHSQCNPKTPQAHSSMKSMNSHANNGNISMQVTSSKDFMYSIQNNSFSEDQVSSTVHKQSLKKSETSKLKSVTNVEMMVRNKTGPTIESKQDMKESDQLQCRVKSAIEKSMDVIKKFKLIKESKA